MSLQAVAELARERKKQEAENAANMARLKEVAPDLHALVDINNMRLDEALGALEVREENARKEAEAAKQAAREGATHRLEQIMTRICLGDRTPEDTAARLMESSI